MQKLPQDCTWWLFYTRYIMHYKDGTAQQKLNLTLASPILLLLRTLLLRYYFCYARRNDNMCWIATFARAMGQGGRWARATMAGRVDGAKNLSPLIALLGLLIRRKLPRNGIFTYHVCLTHPFAPERLILWGCVIYHLAHQSCEFRLHSQKLISPVWS